MNYEHVVIDGERWDILDEFRGKSDAIEAKDGWKQHLREVRNRPNAIVKIESRRDLNGNLEWLLVARG